MIHNNLTIHHLSLSSFQSFADTVNIPIAPLTLLYGPNSAGKSAIHDAFDLLSRFWKTLAVDAPKSMWEFSPGLRRNAALSRHWHRIANANYNNKPLIMEVEFSIPSYLLLETSVSIKHDMRELIKRGGEKEKVKARIEFYPPIQDAKIFISIDINDGPILKYTEGEEISLKADHPHFGKSSNLQKVEWLRPVISDSGWIKLNGPIMLDGHRDFDADKILKPIEDQGNYALIYEAVEALYYFRELVTKLLRRWSAAINMACNISLVAASRTVPDDKELTYILDEKLNLTDGSGLGLTLNSRDEFKELARSSAINMLIRIDKNKAVEMHREDANLSIKINQLLDSYFFTDRIFQVHSEIKKFASSTGEIGFDSSNGQYLVRIQLTDAQGRRLSLTDVGSGVGYSLPIFTALAETGNAFLQQPELHLHPALQSNMGDALIESTSGKSRLLIIETHSEHILLRILRRIRQTNDGRKGILSISSEDVSVIYFDPKLDGTSTAISLPISKSGEFTRKWPRGFFNERDEDLFNE